MKVLKKIINRFFTIFLLNRPYSLIDYWEKRARIYGKRSVLNIGHTDDEFDEVTTMQKEKIFPILKQQLSGNEKMILDFGCGPGRFTSDLADIIQGYAIGVDPIQSLIDLASLSQNKCVEYRIMNEGIIPLETATVDIVWICLVLGGITDCGVLQRTRDEIDRVLKSNGLLFLVENTSEKDNAGYWKFRSVREYRDLLRPFDLDVLSEYWDIGERISIMAGRRDV
jgi:SAM-dependent methyltransferase